MSQIHINPSALNGNISGLGQTISKLSSIRSNVNSLKFGIDSKISSRSSIQSRLSNATSSMQDVEHDLNQLKSFITNTVQKYQTAEGRVSQKGQQLEDMLNDFRKNLMPSNLYEFYNNTWGVVDGLITAGAYSGSAFLYQALGFQFEKMDNGLYRFITSDKTFKKFNIPTGRVVDFIERNKYLNAAARFLTKPSSLFLHKDKSLSELIYNKFTKQYPKTVVNYANNVKAMMIGASDDGARGVMNVIKNNAGTMAKTSLRFLKGNALLAGGITLVTEGIGATIKITENYALYGNDIEKLKTENAKVVGEAAYKTVVNTAASTAGAVILGGALSVLGPVGTVVGASVGGFLGSLVGDAITKHTPQWVTDTAVKFKDTIHKGTEFIGKGVDKVKEGFNAVKENAANLVKGAGNFFSKLGFGG
ncbi:hypothetical protein RGU12_18500 [Fredinandcohnia sp. QZ13]|uniref:hypothetical protein n=1 Tax=Fredinandcohnia sp. QZ13 TaxID=3073144 RepID=UPI0028532C54|nr:hypothetical protein [Fredinandcohnia sp. QZ13]MDR4889486.1 hypothetical protein [Fredinandcohnia sp. QZ13]